MQAKFDYAAAILGLDKAQLLERREQRVQEFTLPGFSAMLRCPALT